MKTGGSRRLATAGVMLAGFWIVPISGMAADIFVNTTADSNDGLCIASFPCSLRDAVMIANSNPGRDTIHLPAGVFQLTIAGTGGADEGDLDIFDDVDIVGAGADVTVIDGLLADDNIFQIPGDGVPGFPLLQLFDLTVTGAGSRAVISTDADVYLWRCAVRHNTGGIQAVSGTVLVVDSVVRVNAPGGGVQIGGAGSFLWVLRSTIGPDNAGQEWGGIFCGTDASVTITNSTVTGNFVIGGTWGGLYAIDCDVVITGSTLAGNLQDDLDLNPLFPSTATVRNTYIGSVCPPDTANQVTSEGGNVGSLNCGFNHQSDIDFSGGTAILLPLADYGGHTPTMPPRGAPNPLVDNPGADANCLTDDQRGVSRPQYGGGALTACDTGAVERTHIFIDGFESGNTSNWSSTAP